MKYRQSLTALLVLLSTLPAFGQNTVLQGGARTSGHVPMYVGSGSGGQTTVQDSGPASGGAVGLGISEFMMTHRGTGTPPYAGQGTGPYGATHCMYDAPITNATGYHYFCLDANAQGGGLIAYGAGGVASALPLQIILNGVTYPFPFSTSGIVGPGTTIVGDLVLWNNTTGTLVKDAGYGISGINANVLNTQTSNYTIASTDCGKTIQAGTGSTGQFTLTLPSVSGFATNCSVSIKNGDTSRGKILSGFPADFSGPQNVLWPSASGVVKIINGAWATGVNPGIWNAPFAVTLQVNHATGSDSSNDCLGTGAGACRTIYHAFQLLQTTVKSSIASNPTIQSDCDFTETPPNAFLGPAASGPGGVVFILGNTSTPSLCTWTSAGMEMDDGVIISLQGFRTATVTTSQTWVTIGKLGLLAFINMVWGPAPSGVHVRLSGAGANFVWDGGSYQIGDATCAPDCFTYHIDNRGGSVALQQATGGTIPNALNFTSFYNGTDSGSQARFTTAFTGAGSGAGSGGSKYTIARLSTLALFSTTGVPGSGGSVFSGACVDDGCSKIANTQFPTAVAFASLASCSGTLEGAMNAVTDSSTAVWGATITGGGANHVNGYCNGANWTVMGK